MMTRRVVSSVAAFLLIASISMAGTGGEWRGTVDSDWSNTANWNLWGDPADYPDEHAMIQDLWDDNFPVIQDGQDFAVELLSFNWYGYTEGKVAELTVASGGKLFASGHLVTNQGGIDGGFIEEGDVVITVEEGGRLDATHLIMGQTGTSTTIYLDGASQIAILKMYDGDNLIILGDNAQLWLMTFWWNEFGNDVLLNDKIIAENEAPGFGVTKILEDENWTVLGVGALDYFERDVMVDGDMEEGNFGRVPGWNAWGGPATSTWSFTTEDDAGGGVQCLQAVMTDFAGEATWAVNQGHPAFPGELYRLELDYKTIDFEQRPEEGSDLHVGVRFYDAAWNQLPESIFINLGSTEGEWVNVQSGTIQAPEDASTWGFAIWASIFGNSKGTVRLDNVKVFESILDEYVGADVTTWQADPNGPAPTDWNRAANWGFGIPGTASLVLFGWVFEVGEEYFANPLAVIDEPVLPFNALGMGWWDSMGNEPNDVALDWEIHITDGGEMNILEFFWMGHGAETTNTLVVDGGSLTVPSLDVARAFGSEATVYHSGGEVNVTAWLNFGGGDGVYYISDDAVLTLAGDQRSYVLDQLVPWGLLVPILTGDEELFVEFDGANTIISIDVPLCGVFLDGDINRDCVVDLEDLMLLVDAWLDQTPIFIDLDNEWFADMSVDPVELDNFYRREGLEAADAYEIDGGKLIFESTFIGQLDALIDTFPVQFFKGQINVSARIKTTQITSEFDFDPTFGEVGPPAVIIPINTDQDDFHLLEWVVARRSATEQELVFVVGRADQLLTLEFAAGEFIEFEATVDADNFTMDLVATDGTTVYNESVNFETATTFAGPAGETFISLASHGIAGEVDFIDFAVEGQLEQDVELPVDLSGSDSVDLSDFAILASDWLDDTIGVFE